MEITNLQLSSVSRRPPPSEFRDELLSWREYAPNVKILIHPGYGLQPGLQRIFIKLDKFSMQCINGTLYYRVYSVKRKLY